jgi:hypothetical protein
MALSDDDNNKPKELEYYKLARISAKQNDNRSRNVTIRNLNNRIF